MTDNTDSTNKHRVVEITPAAVSEIKRLLEKESDKTLFLRIGVAAGGCSGMSYVMAFDSNRSEHDEQFDYEGLSVVVDSRALPYLSGSLLDYKGGLLAGGFQFENPNARRSCGCGSSFTC